MRHFFVCILLISFGQLKAQSFSFTHDGNPRTYWVHLPAGYTNSVPHPLVLNFHGYTSNGVQQMNYSLMNTVADTAGFISVYPDGINNSWNVGFGLAAYFTGVDDVGFTNALIDTLIAHYNIDQEQIFATGMSNGGYFSNRLACELPNRIAAIASVTGPMTDSTRAYCNPSRKVPVMHIHGTSDGIVPYNGGAQSMSVQELVDFWTDHDNCPVSSTDTPYTNVSTTDNCTATRKDFAPCDNESEVVLIEITNGGHTWPGAAVDIAMYGNTNRDFFASGVIWDFFRKFRLNQFIGVEEENEQWINIHPNPAHEFLYISPGIEYVIYNLKGVVLMEGKSGNEPINVQDLKVGMYLVQLKTNQTTVVRKIFKI